MKKSFFANIIVLTIAAALLLTGCADDAVQIGGTAVEEQSAVHPAAADITAKIMEQVEIPSAMEKTAENLGAYYDIDTVTVAEMSVYICGSGAYPDELAVFRFADEDSAAVGAEAVRSRLDSQTAIYKDYTPDEMYKLEGAVVYTDGCWVAFAACADNDLAADVFEQYI